MTGAIIGLILVTALALMAAMSVRADRRLSRGELPTHFDIRGRADAFGLRWVVLAIIPLSYLGAVALVAVLLALAPDSNPPLPGEMLSAYLSMAVIMPVTHGFILWLTLRWARGRG